MLYARAEKTLDRLTSRRHLQVVVPMRNCGVVQSPAYYFRGVVSTASGGPSFLPDSDTIAIIGALVDYPCAYAEPPIPCASGPHRR